MGVGPGTVINGRYIVENGLGREITKDETTEILRECADDGLVHGVSNWEKGVDTICNCCKCCCIWMEAYHKLGHSRSLDPSGYRVNVDPKLCTGCGLCAKRCPMDALCLEESPEAGNKTGKVAVENRTVCIGCGVCVHKCPAGAVTLEQIDASKMEDPPENAMDYLRQYLADRHAARTDG